VARRREAERELERAERQRAKRSRLPTVNAASLSFAAQRDSASESSGSTNDDNNDDNNDDDNDDDNDDKHGNVRDSRGEDDDDSNHCANEAGAIKRNSDAVAARTAAFGKDPAVDTSFLPDRGREAAARAERAELKREWEEAQERIKREPLRVTYSYWDGRGHRRSATCTKGTTIGRFLQLVQREFARELRAVSDAAEELLFVKEDVIVPSHVSFYELVVTQARGKSGPLFDFAVRDDVRLVADATREKEDSHAAKVVERRWYERNKHIFPASRWEMYHPDKSFQAYTTHGLELR